MKKFILLLFLLFLIAFTNVFCYASDDNDSNWGVPLDSQDRKQAGEASESTWNNEKNGIIYEDYGSNQSPSFLNIENTDLYDSGNGGDPFNSND